jgi:DivIVA domain-containing protein
MSTASTPKVGKLTRPEQLIPDTIADTQFTTVRWGKVGYDETEVDDFLDLTEARVEQLMRDLDEARAARPVVEEVRAALDVEQMTGEITAALLAVNENARRVGKRAVVSPPFLPGVAEAVAAHLLTAPEPVSEPALGGHGHLTPAEHRVVTLLGQAWTTLVQEVVEPDRQQHADLSELVGPMHTLQNAVLAQAAARAYPDRYRRLGTSINAEADDE